jgi:hypothetical protein
MVSATGKKLLIGSRLGREPISVSVWYTWELRVILAKIVGAYELEMVDKDIDCVRDNRTLSSMNEAGDKDAIHLAKA